MLKAAKALAARADFVVSIGFCSVHKPFFIAQRERGQSGINVTYFRDFDLFSKCDTIVEVAGEFVEAVILRDMLVSSCLIKLGCGSNSKAARHTTYRAGSNAPGACTLALTCPTQQLHFVHDFQ